jgi:hypothetical protein
MRKYSHTGGVSARRQRALDRLKSIKETDIKEHHLRDIEILTKRVLESYNN